MAFGGNSISLNRRKALQPSVLDLRFKIDTSVSPPTCSNNSIVVVDNLDHSYTFTIQKIIRKYVHFNVQPIWSSATPTGADAGKTKLVQNANTSQGFNVFTVSLVKMDGSANVTVPGGFYLEMTTSDAGFGY